METEPEPIAARSPGPCKGLPSIHTEPGMTSRRRPTKCFNLEDFQFGGRDLWIQAGDATGALGR